jgi:hypothetical protein
MLYTYAATVFYSTVTCYGPRMLIFCNVALGHTKINKTSADRCIPHIFSNKPYVDFCHKRTSRTQENIRFASESDFRID